jgi:hypothetical protein
MSEILFSSNNELMNLLALNFGLISPEDMNFTGSIKVVPEMVNTIASFNVSLPEAALQTQKYVGNNSDVMDAGLVIKQSCAVSRSKPIWGWSDGGEWSTQAAKCIRPSNTKE